MAWVHRGVASEPPCAQSYPPLVMLGSTCSLTPTPGSSHPPILYFAYPFPYPSFAWTGPPGAPSTCNTFPITANHTIAGKLCHLSPSSALGRRRRSSILMHWRSREWEVTRQEKKRRGRKPMEGEAVFFHTGQRKPVFNNTRILYFYNRIKSITLISGNIFQYLKISDNI